MRNSSQKNNSSESSGAQRTLFEIKFQWPVPDCETVPGAHISHRYVGSAGLEPASRLSGIVLLSRYASTNELIGSSAKGYFRQLVSFQGSCDGA